MNNLIRYWKGLNGGTLETESSSGEQDDRNLKRPKRSQSVPSSESDNDLNADEQFVIAREVPELPIHHMNKTPGRLLRQDGSQPSNDRDENFGQNMVQQEENTDEMNGVESGSAERPPLVGRYPRIVPYSARNGSPGSAISLTEKLVWEMNTVFRCENKIRHFQVKIEEIDDTHDKVSDMIEKIKSHIDNLEAGEDLSPHEKNLQTMYDTVADLQGERIEWLEKIELAREELSMPKEGMYRDLEFLLAKNNLLEDISGNDPDHLPWNADVPAAAPEQVEAPEKTPSQIAHETLEIQQWQARDTKGRMEGLLRAARDRVANWHEVYEAKLKDYNELVDAGVDLDTTRTEFDVLLLQEEIEATQDLGRAELDYKVAIHDAQQLGVIFKDEEQDSDFLEQFRAQENDGYRLSIEHDLIDHVDSHRIEKWMGMTSDGEPAAPACDDWDFKSIGFGEGVSVIAEGFSRKRIDHWRCVCEDTQRHMDDNISREHDDLYEEDDRHFHNGEQ